MLQLLLEIPNPGGRGRRLVTSTAGPGSVTHAHTHARTGAEGPDFLAVEWPAIQRLEGQAIRDDADRVMLIGVDTSRLPSGERDRIRDAVRELRPEILRILASIDWNTAGHETVIESAALVDLLRGPVFSNLPTHAQVSPSWETGTAATERPSVGTLPRVLALAGSAIVLGAIIRGWLGPSIPPPPPPPPPDVALEEAAKAMRCSEQDLRSWINSAQGKPVDSPIDDLTLRLVSEPDGVARFFAFDPIPAEQSQLRDFIELLNLRSADECTAVRVGLRKAHPFLLALRASAAAAGRCDDWLPKLESKTDRDLDPLPRNHVAFIKSLVSVGVYPAGDGKTAPELESPFFNENDHRQFTDLAGLFASDRRSPMNDAIGREMYVSDKMSEALFEAVKEMPLKSAERKQLRTMGVLAASRAKCPEIEELIKHFIDICEALDDLPRAGKEP